jgi:hypothetical protein
LEEDLAERKSKCSELIQESKKLKASISNLHNVKEVLNDTFTTEGNLK